MIVTGKLEEGTFVGEKDSLITKCPSKFTTDSQGQSSLTILGKALLAAALLVALYAIGSAIYGARSGDRRWVHSSRRAVYAMAAPPSPRSS